MMPPFLVFPTNRIAHFVEVSLYLFYLAQQVKLDKLRPISPEQFSNIKLMQKLQQTVQDLILQLQILQVLQMVALYGAIKFLLL